MSDRMPSVFRYRPSVRRGKRLIRATLSPAGLVTGGVLAGVGLVTGIPAGFVIGAALASWLTSVVLHLRDPKLAAEMLAPDFDRDLTRLDQQHRPMMVSALQARDRLEEAMGSFPSGSEFGGMHARVTETLRRLYDSVIWIQRASRFLASVDERSLQTRFQALATGPVKDELGAQLAEVGRVRQRREETLARVAATVTGIDTLAVKAHSISLDASTPDQPIDEVRALREELDAYDAGLEELERHLREALPGG
jgi:hypothetical protein